MAGVNVTFPGNLAQVQTAADLRSIPSTFIADGDLYLVNGLQGLFEYDPGSVSIDDGQDIIRPNDKTPLQAGRWIRNVDGLASGPIGETGPANSTYDAPATVTAQADVTNQSAIVADPSRGGTFAYKTGNFASRIAADVRRAIYIPALGDPTGANGAWVRIGVTQFDVHWFGAIGDGITNDTAAIQAAIDLAEFDGGRTVFLARGEYLTTSTLKITARTSLIGEGVCSIIRPQACDTFQMLKSDSIAPRRIGNFRIYGNGCDDKRAVYADIAFPERVTGLIFENMFIDFYGTGFTGRGFWNADFNAIAMNEVLRPFYFYDRNVKIMGADIKANRGTLIVGTGEAIGLQVGGDTDLNRPEDVHFDRCIFYGYNRGVYWRNCLYGSVDRCDLDYCTEVVLDVVTADGGTSFSRIWGQVDNTTKDVYGLRLQPLGVVPGIGTVGFSTVRLSATNVKTVPGEMHAFGLSIGDKQANITIDGLSVEGAFQADQVNGARRSSIKNVNSTAPAFLFNTESTSFSGNTWLGGITLSGNVNTDFGKNFGLHTTEILGSISVPAGATSATATFLSLNMPDLPLGSYSIAVTATDRGNLTHGGIAIVPTRTGITVYCQTAIPNLPSIIDFQLRIY